MQTDLDLTTGAIIFAALALGGTLKGATGAGVPIIGVPVIAAAYDVRLAVAILATTNLFSNLTQLFAYRAHHISGGFAWRFATAGMTGAVFGTVLLANLPGEALSLMVAAAVLVYIALRLTRPGMRLPIEAARRLLWPIGGVAGVLQGAAGISAPISVSFLNAMRLERPVFIATISAFFASMSLVQIPVLAYYGLVTPLLFVVGLAALLPIFAFMPVGAWLARRLSPQSFDRIILVLLAGLASKLIWDALWG